MTDMPDNTPALPASVADCESRVQYALDDLAVARAVWTTECGTDDGHALIEMADDLVAAAQELRDRVVDDVATVRVAPRVVDDRVLEQIVTAWSP